MIVVHVSSFYWTDIPCQRRLGSMTIPLKTFSLTIACTLRKFMLA